MNSKKPKDTKTKGKRPYQNTGYDKEAMYQLALDLCANDSDITFIQDVIAQMPFSPDTFYRMFPNGSEESDNIKKLIYNNKVTTKQKLRKNWKSPEASAPLQISLYKLLADEEELARPSNTELPKSDKIPAIVELVPDKLADSDNEIDD